MLYIKLSVFHVYGKQRDALNAPAHLTTPNMFAWVLRCHSNLFSQHDHIHS